MLRQARISDIARKAGVSVGTASNVINNRAVHSQPTRDRVLKAAAELHFTPNALIRSLQTGKTGTIGVFCWRVSNAPRGQLLPLFAGVASGIDALGLDILIYSRHPHEGGVPAAYFLDSRVDGLIIVPGGLIDGELEALESAALPTVALYQNPTPPGIGAINIDNLDGVEQAIHHLVQMGHRRIAFCAPTYTFDYRQRKEGYLASLECNGITVVPELVYDLDREYQTQLPALCRQLISKDIGATAMLAGDDGIALDFLDCFHGLGISVPKQISIVGFDDVLDALERGLTTVRQPANEVGRMAAEFVGNLIVGGPASTCKRVLPVSLIPRRTTASQGL